MCWKMKTFRPSLKSRYVSAPCGSPVARKCSGQSLMLRIFAGILCLLLVHAAEEEVTEARLLVQKRILNKFLVEGKDIIVDYNIYNVGGSAALDIKVSDNSFNPAYFEVTSGLLSFKLNRLAPGSNVTHTVVIRPLTFGYFNFTSADVSYRTSEDSQEIQFAHTAEPGQGGIMPVRDFDRKFSPHVTDWLAFAIMTLPSLGIPFVLWFNSKSKYEAIVKQFKKH
ncbi:translocon-associated protein subunit beta isoform X2 [Dermacentor albipictus]|uniref:translocon-associated protein subunit beta isoform X2 n=1 Tax=Dermacentor albipictus TaxID=60249 RepID=UPI0031FBB57A